MPDVLSQSEVDALLAAVDEMPAEGSAAAAGSPDDVAAYDFTRPERAGREQLRAIESMHELLARNFAATLSGMLRSVVEVSLSTVDQLTYSEFIASLPSPTCFSLITAQPLEGRMVLEMNPSIVYAMIDKLLGGPATSVMIDRPMTEIERNLMERVISTMLDLMRDAWRPISDISFDLHATESNPQLVQIAPPTEPVILIIFDVRMGEAAGLFNICIPYKTIEPVMEGFTTIQSWFASERREQRPDELAGIVKALGGGRLEMVVDVASASMTIEDLTELQVGDIITTGRRAGSPLLLSIGGKPKFFGEAGKRGNRKSLLVTGRTGSEERI